MKKNDYIDLTCQYLAADGKGVVKTNDYCFYLDNFLPNEKCNAIIEGINGKTVYARVVDLENKSNDRVNVKCNTYDKCGSCKLLHLDYKKQLEFKKNNVIQLFKNQGLKVKVNDCVGMDNPLNYRNKTIASFSMNKNKVIYGMYEEGSHDVVYNDSCLIQNKTINDILKTIKLEMDNLKIKVEGFNGVLRHVMLRIGVKTNEVLVVFVTNNEMFPGRNELVKRLTTKHKEIKTIIQNTNPRNTSVVLGDKERVLFGPGFIFDELLGIRYKISAKSFYQVNPIQTEKLYSKAIELAKISKNDTVMDAYCGIGTIGLSLAKYAKNVIGVEINKDAINDAINNAKANHITNARFFASDVKAYMKDFNGVVDTLIIDPPRSGCDIEFLNSVKKLKPKKIVYISCNPVTQVSDISKLSDLYSVSEAYPFDMFPNTIHVECVALLSLKSAK